MSKKLLKRNCFVLIRAINGNRKPSVSILGVFKKQKEAQAYLKWLNPKDTENYDIRPSKRFVYVNTWEKEKENDKSTTVNSNSNSITNLHNEQYNNLYKDFTKI